VNLIALETLNALIKLEAHALDWLSGQKGFYYDSWLPMANRVNDWCLSVTNAITPRVFSFGFTKRMFSLVLNDGSDFTLSLLVIAVTPRSVETGLESSPSNTRFIRSSWVLSLLWTAKFYSALEFLYAKNDGRDHAFIYFVKAYKALEREVEQYFNQSLEDNSEILHDWVMFDVPYRRKNPHCI
jgi:hypothetical protein